MSQESHDHDFKKLRPLTIPKIVEQLERVLMDIKYNTNRSYLNELMFNQSSTIPLKSELPAQFIGKELVLFEMIGILNGKITELQKKYEKLKTNEDNEEEFLSEKANEIINPVQEIFDFAKLAKAGKIDQNEAWDSVLAVAQKLQAATTVLLDANRIENNRLRLTLDKVKINELVSDVVSTIKSESQVPIRLGLDYDVEISADKVRLKRAIQTILKNSIYNTEDGYIKVETLVAHEQNVVIVRINDTGKGVPNHILSKIFEKPITPKKTTRAEKVELRLDLCKAIIKAHNGTITAKNNKDVGTTYTITLPIDKK